MYRLVIERQAEKDLDRLHSGVRVRVIEAIQELAKQPRTPGSVSWWVANPIGGFASAITGSCIKSPIPCES